ncbi:MAG TPA: hypothetical protein VNS63_27500, partial [Blastocatellia bacterium]|nr:hypothetical protein [Blastocatellia bacterium]
MASDRIRTWTDEMDHNGSDPREPVASVSIRVLSAFATIAFLLATTFAQHRPPETAEAHYNR